MSKHSTTPHTLSRRLAALLAALALLAAMALPVYGEPQNEDTTGTTQAEAEIGGTISDGNVTPENDSTPPEEKEMAEGNTPNADEDNASENKETDVDADDRSLDLEDADTSDETYDTISEDSSANSESSDYNQLQDANEAEESHITQISAAQTSDSSFNIYFAVPTKFATKNYTGVMLNYQRSDKQWPGMMEMHLLQNRDYSGRKVYEITIRPGECQECFLTVQFHYLDANGYIVQGTENFEELSGAQHRNDIENKLYDAESKKWQDFTPYDPNNHQTFAGESMTFENLSNESLTNVKALFYEPDSANDGDLKPVSTVEIGNVDTNKRKPFAIPDAACSYIKFTAEGKDDLSDTYNFYGQGNASHFIYNENTKYCFTYRASDASAWGTSQGSITIYFDATLSKLTYNKDKETEAKVPYGMPTADNELWYYAKFADGTTANGMMTQDGTNSNGNIWYVSFTDKTPVSIRFASWDVQNEVAAGNGDGTAMLTVPHNLEQPCFYADTSDAAVYEGGNRDGYWDELGQTRDAAKGKKSTVVDVESAAFTKDGKTKYISSTLYDYYSDWELNGKNRDTYNTNYNNETFANNRNWVTFRQFDQALSDYYRNSGATVNYPMYTGQFQPDAVKSNGEEWGIRFSAIASTLNLYGYANTDTKTFMAVNNSTSDINGNGLAANQTKLYDETFQGLAGSELKNGEPIMNGTTDLAMPFFNEEFLQSENSKKTKLGEVYKDVSFPFTQEEVFKESDDATAYEKGVKYWYFDSDKTTLYLKKDTGDEGYFLQRQSSLADNSKNLLSNSTHAQVNNKDTYGFFPFNSKSTDTKASTYNYGFGAKLQFQFTLTSDGKVKDNSGREIPIKFFFSGDDDVWVYIDDKLALDVGGDHGKASGLLEFGADNNGNNYTSYVSDIKASNNTVYGPVADKAVTYLGNKIKFNYKSTKSTTLEPGTHTLTMYYMERGMWESNMAIAFNFPDNNELQVQKIVDDKNVNELFAGCFDDQRLFNFTIRNQATHYGTVDTETDNVSTINLLEPGKSTSDQKDFTTEATTTGSGNIFEKVENPPEELKDGNSTSLLKWYAKFKDLEPEPGSNKETRYGKLKLNKPIDITGMSYLSFDIYVDSSKGDAALSNMYLQLRDSKGKQKGCLGKTFIGGKMLYGQVEMHNMHWITVKLSLDDMQEQGSFDRNNVTELLFGCNYPRDIYLRNIVFSAKAVPTQITGFTTKQETIADYGSAQKGELMPAVNAQYTSDAEKGTMVVDENGGFVLKNKETITFRDQFRRGSYLSINEQVDTKLFDTKWTIYEDGEAVTSTVDGNKIDLVDNTSKNLTDVEGTAPDDGRIEVKNAEGDSAQIDNYHNAYDGKKPSTKKEDDNTIVFRSYAKPDATDADGQTQLKVEFVNTVRTGSLTIKKQKAQDSDALTGTYHFKVRFTNVGGHALGNKEITWECDLTEGESKEFKDIPVGTRFTIEEVAPTDGSKLVNAIITGGGNDRKVMSNITVRGSISATGTEQATVTFTNSMQETLDIAGTKLWRNADDSPMMEHPDTIYVQLQRRPVGETSESPWTPVTYLNETYTAVEQDHDGMNFSFLNLPAKDYSKPEHPNFEYRVVEGSVDGSGFHAFEDGKTITIGEKVYGVKYNPETVTANNSSVTITNQLQDPKFNLDITKADAKDGTTPLKDVEFTLVKLDENNKVVAGSAKCGITNDQGKLMSKGEDGNPTKDSAFTGLEAGKYRLTETKAAENYNLLSAPIEVEFTKTGQCSLNGSKIEVNTTDKPTDFIKYGNDSYTLKLTVLNRKTPALPHTGADAPSLWLLIGLPLAVAGLLILVFRYNKKGGRTR